MIKEDQIEKTKIAKMRGKHMMLSLDGLNNIPVNSALQFGTLKLKNVMLVFVNNE